MDKSIKNRVMANIWESQGARQRSRFNSLYPSACNAIKYGITDQFTERFFGIEIHVELERIRQRLIKKNNWYYHSGYTSKKKQCRTRVFAITERMRSIEDEYLVRAMMK